MDAAVKVDGKLLKEIEKLISENEYLYSSRKQVVNLAILEFLNLRNSLQISDDSKKPKNKGGFLKSKLLLNKSSKKADKGKGGPQSIPR